MMTIDQREILTICICTYNRHDYLTTCLDRLIPQIKGQPVSIVVIDNNSDDGTRAYVHKLRKTNPIIRYYFEQQQGLSYARNTAWNIASGDWVFYLDDDCLPSDTIVQSTLDLIAMHPQAEAIGGPIDAVSETPLPDWLPEGYGSFSMPFTSMTLIDKGFIRGGCFLIRKSTLASLHGFNTHYGVTGEQLRYGEEIELQLRMRQQGLKVAYAPQLRIGHHVRSEKMSLRWVLHSAYARRRDKMRIEPISMVKASLHLLRTLLGRIIWIPIHLASVLFKPGYSFQKAIYQILQPLAFRLGEFTGVIQRCNYSQK